MLRELLLEHGLTLGLAASRIAGFTITSPFPGEHVTNSQKIGFTCLLTYLVASTSPALELGGGSLLLAAASEVALGGLIGAVFRFGMGAADVLGGALSQATGLGAPSVFNPLHGAQDTALGQAMGLLALLLCFAIGAHRVAIAYLLESFHTLPIGRPLAIPLSAPLFVELMGQALAVGTRLALPAIVVSLAVQTALAMIARAAPSLQIFSIGFTVMIITGFLSVAASLRMITEGLAHHLAGLAPALDRLFEILGAA